MTLLPGNTQIYLAVGGTDMRKSINGLSSIVMDEFELDPFSGNLFGFCNKIRKIIKILFWDKNGFCIWQLNGTDKGFQGLLFNTFYR